MEPTHNSLIQSLAPMGEPFPLQQAVETTDKVNYEIVEDGEDIEITLDEDYTPQELETAIDTATRNKYWFLRDEFGQQPIQKYRVIIDQKNERGVDIYSLQENGSTTEAIQEISNALSAFYFHLKDKSLWNLDSVQILDNSTGQKEGVDLGGREYPLESRFEIYPNSAQEPRYWDLINCSGIEGVTVHESAHVVLGHILAKLWELSSRQLGWVTLDELGLGDRIINSPSGGMTEYINILPEDLPLPYAAGQRDDDQAESVVAWIYDREILNPIRRELLATVLEENPNITLPIITKVEPEYPRLRKVKVKVKSQATSDFVVSEVRQGRKKVPISREEVLKMISLELIGELTDHAKTRFLV